MDSGIPCNAKAEVIIPIRKFRLNCRDSPFSFVLSHSAYFHKTPVSLNQVIGRSLFRIHQVFYEDVARENLSYA